MDRTSGVAAALVLALAGAAATNGIVAAGQSAGASTAPSDVTFRIIVASTVESARALRDRVMRGAAFEELARSESIDPPAARGGLIGPVALRELRPELRDAVAALAVGATSDVLPVPTGFAIVQLATTAVGRTRIRATEIPGLAAVGSVRTMHRTVTSGGSFGASPLEQHVGLGGGVRRVDVEVTWPVSRTTHRFANVQPNQVLRIRELDDRPAPLPRPRLPLARATAGLAASRPVEVTRAR